MPGLLTLLLLLALGTRANYLKIETWYSSTTCAGEADIHYSAPTSDTCLSNEFIWRDILVAQPATAPQKWSLCSSTSWSSASAPTLLSAPQSAAVWSTDPLCTALTSIDTFDPSKCYQIGATGSIRVACVPCHIESLPLLTLGNTLALMDVSRPSDCGLVDHVTGCVDLCPSGYACCPGCLTNNMGQFGGKRWVRGSSQLRRECSCCVPINLFYFCNGCTKCEPGWLYPVHRAEHCASNTSIPYSAALGGHFHSSISMCQKWRVQTDDCDYTDSLLRINTASSNFAGYHREMKFLLRSAVLCHGSDLSYYEAKGFMVGELGFIFSVSHSYGNSGRGAHKDTVLSGDFTDATRKSFTATERTIDVPGGSAATLRTLNGTCIE